MNIAQVNYRRTVSGLFYCMGSNDTPLIGIHWPMKAALAEESNLSPVAGAWKEGESAQAAMRRQVMVEYGPQAEIKIVPLIHDRFVSNATQKQYHWLLVELKRPTGDISYKSIPHITANNREVASFGWYGPAELEGAIRLMHLEKQYMFRKILEIAIAIETDLIPFRKRFG